MPQRSLGPVLAAWVVATATGCRAPVEARTPSEDSSRYSATPPPPASPTQEASSPPTSVEPEHERPPSVVYRTEIDRALAGGPGYLLGQLRPEPHRVSGQFVGWRITAVFPDDPSLCDPCDLHEGDIVLSVNGDRLQTPAAFSDLLQTLADARELEVVSLRAGKRHQANYRLIDDRGATGRATTP